ncbi:TrmB family transcriptional regulator [Halobacillus litoralis]|uniref:TrmB family transcriptional regulator n=1 Tax=Halobacillus litoralis TaxID=45668 RepID=UPI001CD54AE4|nr:TrmB family transcriptional regulator [Halobacillus litoralis]MCA0971713.1 TrmB family transcriptional regulator [Halobacillus litoralis]
MLQKFGFTQYESQVFEVLTASEEPLDATTVGKYSQVPKSKVYEVLNRLMDKGLLKTSFTNRKKLYTALPLDTTIKKLTAEFEANVEELKSKEYTMTTNDDRVWTIQNAEAISSLSQDLVERAESSIHISGWSDDLSRLLPLLEHKQLEGITVELLSVGEMSTRLSDAHILMPDQNHQALERHQLLIIDGKEIVLAGVEHDEWQGIQTQSSPLVKFFTEFFYHDVALTEITKKYEDTLKKDEQIQSILMKLRY